MMTVTEIADAFRVSEDTVRRLIATGELRGTRVGRSVRVRDDIVARYIAEHTEPHTATA